MVFTDDGGTTASQSLPSTVSERLRMRASSASAWSSSVPVKMSSSLRVEDRVALARRPATASTSLAGVGASDPRWPQSPPCILHKRSGPDTGDEPANHAGPLRDDSLFANHLFCETITHAIYFDGGPALWLRVGDSG